MKRETTSQLLARLTEPELAEGLRLWQDKSVPTTEVQRVLAIEHKTDLYVLRRHLKWPPRVSGGVPRHEPTPDQLRAGKDAWDRNAPMKELVAIMGLEDRYQVYRIAQREWWKPRERREGPQRKFQREVRQALDALRAEGPREPVPPVRRRPDPAEELRLQRERVRLPQTCPACGYRVLPGPEAVAIEGELFHRVHAPQVAA